MHVALPKSRGLDKSQGGEQRLGFLAAGKDPELGYVGGFLLTTVHGRPLEFHFTTPIKPSPTHRILYGAELEPYIVGELIAANLLRQSPLEPAFLITDQPLVLGLRSTSLAPIVCVASLSVQPLSADSNPEAIEFQTHSNFTNDLESLQKWISETSPGLDLREPFGRIWQALREVLRVETKSTSPKQAA